MLNFSKLSTLCWHSSLLLALIGPAVVKAQSATVLAEAGCSAFYYWDGKNMVYQWVCDDNPAIALPEAYVYGNYHYYLDVLTGFPVDTTSKKTRPKFRETYKWMNKNLVTVGLDNCLYANMKIGDFFVKHILGDQVGICPPSKIDSDEKELFENPYYIREEERRAAAANNDFVAADKETPNPTSDFVANNNAPGVPVPNNKIPETPVVNTPVGFSAEEEGWPPTPQQLSDEEVAFGNMDFLSADFPSG